MYSWFHKNVKYCFHWNFSRFDKLTLASALDDRDSVDKIGILVGVYSLIAYTFILSFCYEMSNTEFTNAE